jgi:hypothetical protein
LPLAQRAVNSPEVLANVPHPPNPVDHVAIVARFQEKLTSMKDNDLLTGSLKRKISDLTSFSATHCYYTG